MGCDASQPIEIQESKESQLENSINAEKSRDAPIPQPVTITDMPNPMEEKQRLLLLMQKQFGSVPAAISALPPYPFIVSFESMKVSTMFHLIINRAKNTKMFCPFTLTEQTVLLLTTSVVNNCIYCSTAHTYQLLQYCPELLLHEVESIIDQQISATLSPRLKSIIRLTRELLLTGAQLSPSQMEEYIRLPSEEGGFTFEEIQSVATLTGIKTLANWYTCGACVTVDRANHLQKPQLELEMTSKIKEKLGKKFVETSSGLKFREDT